MTNETIVQALKAAIHQLEREKLRIDESVEVLKDTLRYFENPKVSPISAIDVSSPVNSPQPELGRPGARQRHPTAKSPPDVIAEILRVESPLHRREIYERLEEKGVHIGGQTPLNTVSTYLSVDGRFKNVGRGIWCLSRPLLEPADIVDDNAYENDSDEEEEDVPW